MRNGDLGMRIETGRESRIENWGKLHMGSHKTRPCAPFCLLPVAFCLFSALRHKKKGEPDGSPDRWCFLYFYILVRRLFDMAGQTETTVII